VITDGNRTTMKAHPRNPSVAAGSGTWSLIRGGCPSGVSAPTAGVRFGATAISERARRRGGTGRRFAATAAPWVGSAPDFRRIGRGRTR
jgi:hypothetical protein